MSKIAFFLGFQPGVNLTNEGIGRLLAFILKEKEKENDTKTIVLVCPAWLAESIDSLMKDNKIEKSKFEILSTSNIPLGVKLKDWLQRRGKREKKKSRFSVWIDKVVSNLYTYIEKRVLDFFSTSSIIQLGVKGLAYLLLIILLSPFILVTIVFYLLVVSVKKVVRFVEKVIRRVFTRVSILQKVSNKLISGKSKMYQIVIDNELNKLVKIINRREDIKACFIPSMIWPQTQHLKCNKILAAPDIVFYDFPTQFSGVSDVHSRIRKSIEVADHLISYSEYVKNHHLVEKCGVDDSKITVIKHANINMNEHLKLSKTLKKYYSDTQNSEQIISRYIHGNYTPSHVLYDCDVKKMDYIIFSSQYRPHKNIFNLIKSIKIINKEMYRSIKLILTGNIANDEKIISYIKTHHLSNDIFVMHGLSSEVLASFNKFAKCAVNPTLFEGGFPFTFSEAYSVGTPSVMSNIPVVSAEINDIDLRDKMLFDPYNPYSIAQRIVWAVDNANTLFEAQAELYQKFDKRDWKRVVNEYNQVFRKFM